MGQRGLLIHKWNIVRDGREALTANPQEPTTEERKARRDEQKNKQKTKKKKERTERRKEGRELRAERTERTERRKVERKKGDQHVVNEDTIDDSGGCLDTMNRHKQKNGGRRCRWPHVQSCGDGGWVIGKDIFDQPLCPGPLWQGVQADGRRRLFLKDHGFAWLPSTFIIIFLYFIFFKCTNQTWWRQVTCTSTYKSGISAASRLAAK